MAADLDMRPVADRPGAREPAVGTEEVRLLRASLLIVGALAVPTGVVAYLADGWGALASALIGLGFVLLLFSGSALLLVRAARRHDNGIAILVAGALIRLPLYLVCLALLNRVPWVDGRALALATFVAVAVTLALELRLISRSPRMFWIDPEAAGSSAIRDATRS